ncbi:MAG: hypothetical protein AAF533_26550 [Acidobacteriota bacterium]
MNPRHLSLALIALAALVSVSPGPSPVRSCQLPPTPPTPPDTPNPQMLTSLLPVRPIMQRGDEVSFTMGVTNYGDPWRSPSAFYTDDTRVTVDFEARLVRFHETPPEGDCHDPSNIIDLGPLEATWQTLVELDDGYSPGADEDVAWAGRAEVEVELPDEGGDYGILATVHAYAMVTETYQTDWGGGTAEREIAWDSTSESCAIILENVPPFPTAHFEDQINAALAGDWVPMQLVVERNGYEPVDELRVVVTRENPTDPIDLFPVEPAELIGDGSIVSAERSVFEMACGLHFPCFPGMANRLHATIYDGDFPVYLSEWTQPFGLGEACVLRAPLAYMDLLEVEGAVHGDSFTDCGDVEVELAAWARNPTIGGVLRDPELYMAFPEGTEILWVSEPHHHDNPLDDVTPTAGALLADADVVIDGRHLHVFGADVPDRFVDGVAAPEVFYDMLEFEVRVRFPQEMLAEIDELEFWGPWVLGYMGGRLRSDVGAIHRYPVIHGGGGLAGDPTFPGTGRDPRACTDHEVEPGDIRTGDGTSRSGVRTLSARDRVDTGGVRVSGRRFSGE